jgi:hypothetical protein
LRRRPCFGRGGAIDPTAPRLPSEIAKQPQIQSYKTLVNASKFAAGY